jgi:hypothetical protein
VAERVGMQHLFGDQCFNYFIHAQARSLFSHLLQIRHQSNAQLIDDQHDQRTKKKLEQKLWGIANTLRGKMNADEFCDYILGFILYKYLTERPYL